MIGSLAEYGIETLTGYMWSPAYETVSQINSCITMNDS